MCGRFPLRTFVPKICFCVGHRCHVQPHVLHTRHIQLRNFTVLKKQFRSLECGAKRTYASSGQSEDSDNTVEKKYPRGQIFGAAVGKYDVFRDDDSPIILDVDEEKQLRKEHPELFTEKEKEITNEFEGLNLKRGKESVIDIDDLVQALKRQSAVDIFVVHVPPEYNYVDYMVFCSGKSYKHMYAMVSFIRRYFKRKRYSTDPIPRLEGEYSKDWFALDLGNIALHILSKPTREKYDLETLWTVGPKYDTRCNAKDDPLIEILQQFTIQLEPKNDSDGADEIQSDDEDKIKNKT